MVELKRDEKLRVALIGCGSIAAKHVTAMKRIPDIEMVGAFDIDQASRDAFSEQHGIPIFSHIKELVEEADPHVFDILTPSGLHAKNVLELIPFGRHFVVEKPLALRLDQVDDILERCERDGLKMFVVKQNRFNPPLQKLKEAIDKGRLGRPVLGTVRVRWCRRQEYYDQKPWRGTWSSDGGVLTNQASHHIDMLIWMLGDVESVVAKTATRLVDIEAEDTGAAIIKFKSGAMGIVEATTATRPKDLEGSISILGEKGSVEVGGFFMNELKTWNFAEQDPMDELVWEKYSKVPSEKAWNHTEFFKNVLESFRSDSKGLIDGLEGRRSIELISAIYESAESGREIFLESAERKCRLGEECKQ